MKRIVAIDFGLKRIGIAISDERKTIAFPLATVAGGKDAIANVQKALREKGAPVELILIGLPVMLNGQEGDMVPLVKKFAEELHLALQIPIEWIDERFTSKLADQSLKKMDLNRKDRTAKLDTVAATILLQTYLDRKS